jgi:hypothetical protein
MMSTGDVRLGIISNGLSIGKNLPSLIQSLGERRIPVIKAITIEAFITLARKSRSSSKSDSLSSHFFLRCFQFFEILP